MERRDLFVEENSFTNEISQNYPRVIFPDIEAKQDLQLYSFIFIGMYDKKKYKNLLKGYDRWLCESMVDVNTIKFTLVKGMLFEFDIPYKSFNDQVHNYRLTHKVDLIKNEPYLVEFYRYKNKSFVFKNIEIVKNYDYSKLR